MIPAPKRHATAALAAAIPGLVLAYHWRAALPGAAFVGSDLRFFFFAVRDAVAWSLRHGELPQWQRGVFLGYPLLADPQSALFDFATWLTLPWTSAPRALTIATLVHLVVAGWGMAYWMRLRGLGVPEALLAAVLFALGAKQTVHILHWNFAASTAWWPWMLAGIDGFAERGRGRYLLLVAIATGASWFGGSPQMAYFGTLVAGAYACVLAPRLWRRGGLDAFLPFVALALGIAIAAPMLLPVGELARLGPRGAGVDYRFATSWKWTDRFGLALLLLPRAYGGRFGMNLWEATGYLGVLPLALAASAPLRRRGTWLFLALALIGIWLGFGEDAWLGIHWLLYRFLPGYGSFRNPTRSLMVTSFASALLAAEGLAALRARGGDGPRRAARAAAVLAAVAALAPLLRRAPGFSLDVEAARGAATVAVALAVAGVGWLAAGLWFRARPIWALGAVALSLADFALAFGDMNEVAPAASEMMPLADFDPLLPPAPAPRRVAMLAKWGRTANGALREGWEGVTGYGPTAIQRVRSLLEATLDDRLRSPAPLDDDPNFPRPRPTSALWPLFGAPLLISDKPQPFSVIRVGRAEWESPLVAYRTPALPRVFWTGSWQVVPDAGAAGPLFAAVKGDRALLAEPLPGLGNPGEPAGPVAAEDIRVGSRTLVATVVAPRPGPAVVLDPWFPGWKATLDGRPVPLVRADYAFQGVAVPAGRHLLRLEYRNRMLPIGFAVATGALALLLLLLWARRRSDASSRS